MTYAFISLIILSLILLLFSFFKEDKIKSLEQQVEQLSLNALQEQYQTKRRFERLEEELLLPPTYEHLATNKDEGIKKDKKASSLHHNVLQLFSNGMTIDAIAKQLAVPIEEVRLIVNHVKWKER
ncbi:DUF6115 domain-containing protein [Metabacillus iocasae]|uniref:Holliday junction resolvase-like endonuclease n=1 Tax=Priestia iocasae TaxID=2291674 RepID=A0ABS2QQ46_9BACI|nr:hypothetical protein [Metabacillus iocasae]MBM7701525.1 putative Holliday junction resolvase-like endonuclease [Metabacillus iocasae]